MSGNRPTTLRARRGRRVLTNAGHWCRGTFAARPGTERGQGLVEYALILILLAIICIVLVAAIGSQVKSNYSNVSNSFPH